MTKLAIVPVDPAAAAEAKRIKDAEELAAEEKRVGKLSDAQVLELSGNGQYGPGLIGAPLYERAQRIKRETNDGQFGPAITDPDFAKKQAAKRAAEKAAAAAAQDDEPADEGTEGGEGDDSELDPWRATTLSGAKILAQAAGVSYKPGVKKQALIARLKEAGVVPPPVVEADDDEGD